MKLIAVLTTALAFIHCVVGNDRNPVPIYEQPQDNVIHVNNNQIPMPGTEVIKGNIPRTITGYWKTSQKDSYNVYECGTPWKIAGGNFAFGRWFGEHGTSKLGLTCHTWGGCYSDTVGTSGRDVGRSDDTWHHFAHIWDGTNHYLYYDGELYTSGGDKNKKLKTVDTGCVLGSRDTRFNFKGDVKGVKIYKEALTATQIKILAEAVKKCDDLEGWCAGIDIKLDCCSPTIQSKCPWQCDTCPAVHCQWDDWIIGNCSAECGVGTRTNTRVKLVEEKNGGTCTGQPKEVEECKDKECPVHCEWNDWIIGECSKSCGGGTRVDTRTVKVEAKHGGDTCPGPTSIEKSCNVQECPVDCKWSDWKLGDCSATCGNGLREKHRFKEQVELYGGAPCEGDAKMTEQCTEKLCPEQCCIENGVPQRCIGLCIEEKDASQDRFMSICDRYETVIEQCTGENIVLQEDTLTPDCTGGDSCCTSNRQCDVDQGDCDSDSECKQGLKCGSNNCKTKSGFQWDAMDDCCYKPLA